MCFVYQDSYRNFDASASTARGRPANLTHQGDIKINQTKIQLLFTATKISKKHDFFCSGKLNEHGLIVAVPI